MKKGENYNGPKVGSKTVVYPIRRMKDIGVHLFQPTSLSQVIPKGVNRGTTIHRQKTLA
jgi:hypothetical protein